MNLELYLTVTVLFGERSHSAGKSNSVRNVELQSHPSSWRHEDMSSEVDV
jgi:hypothetical protein